MKKLALLAFILLPATTLAQTHEVEAGLGYDSLSSPYNNWQSQYLLYEYTDQADRVWYARVNQTNRFDLSDTEALVGNYFNLAPRWSGHIELSASGTARVRPEFSVFGQLTYEFKPTWLIAAGAQQVKWSQQDATNLHAQIEHYFSLGQGDYSAGYRLQQTRLDGGDSGVGHAIWLSRYYANSAAETNRITFVLGRGDELERISAQQLLVTEVTALTVHGLHWFSTDWAVRWSLTAAEQGDFYDRTGATIGVRYRF